MKIADNLKPASAPAVTGRVSLPTDKPAAPDLPASAPEPVAASTMVFDAARVHQIKTAIAAGTYRVNPERIADGLLATARDLVARQANR